MGSEDGRGGSRVKSTSLLLADSVRARTMLIDRVLDAGMDKGRISGLQLGSLQTGSSTNFFLSRSRYRERTIKQFAMSS